MDNVQIKEDCVNLTDSIVEFIDPATYDWKRAMKNALSQTAGSEYFTYERKKVAGIFRYCANLEYTVQTQKQVYKLQEQGVIKAFEDKIKSMEAAEQKMVSDYKEKILQLENIIASANGQDNVSVEKVKRGRKAKVVETESEGS